MLEGLGVARQLDMDDEAEIGQIDAARGDSVATSTRARPSRSACSAWLRSFWLCSPDSATALKPRSTSELCSRRTFSRVAQNSKALSASCSRSRLTTACSMSAGRHRHRPIGDVAMAAVLADVEMRSASFW